MPDPQLLSGGTADPTRAIPAWAPLAIHRVPVEHLAQRLRHRPKGCAVLIRYIEPTPGVGLARFDTQATEQHDPDGAIAARIQSMLDCLRGMGLTERNLEVWQLVLQEQLPIKTLAERLGISIVTVKHHVRCGLQALGVKSQRAAERRLAVLIRVPASVRR